MHIDRLTAILDAIARAREILKYGTGTISEEGEVTVHVSKDVKFGKLIGQVSWVFYTRLKESGLIE